MAQTSREKRQRLISSLSRSPLELDEIEASYEQFTDASDRAAALTAAALLDHGLKDAIYACFVKLRPSEEKQIFASSGAPLSDLGAKINVAHALGIVEGEDRDEMHSIRIVRNAFAHAPRNLKFTTKAIADECDTLTIGGEHAKFSSNPRARYVFCTFRLLEVLRNFSHRHALKNALMDVNP